VNPESQGTRTDRLWLALLLSIQSRWDWVHPPIAVALALASLKCFQWYAALHRPLMKSSVHNRPLWVLDVARYLLACAALVWSLVAVWRGPRLVGLVALAVSIVACLASQVKK
jgi:hypothetical protein